MSERGSWREAGAGPWVRAALLCEDVSVDEDGALSALRILEVLRGPAPLSTSFTCLLMLTAGGVAPGRHTVHMSTRLPSGEERGRRTSEVEIPEGGPACGFSLLLDVSFQARESGIYWFSFAFDRHENQLTEVPLMVILEAPAHP